MNLLLFFALFLCPLFAAKPDLCVTCIKLSRAIKANLDNDKNKLDIKYGHRIRPDGEFRDDSKVVSYLKSEIRLIKAIDGICDAFEKELKDRCFNLVEDNEDGVILDWFMRGSEGELEDEFCSVDVLGEACNLEAEPEPELEPELKEEGSEDESKNSTSENSDDKTNVVDQMETTSSNKEEL